MKPRNKNQSVMSLGGAAISTVSLGSFNLAMSLDFLVPALLIIIGLSLVIITMLSKSRARN